MENRKICFSQNSSDLNTTFIHSSENQELSRVKQTALHPAALSKEIEW